MKAAVCGVLVLAAFTLAGAQRIGSSAARFVDPASVGGNTLTTDTLNPPTSLTASGGASVTLNWTATVDTYASGYRVLRATASGGPYTQIAQITPRTTVTYPDSPGNGTYYYVVRAYYQNWVSANSNEASATVSTQTNTGWHTCTLSTAQFADTGGDNNGYELSPNNACAVDGAFAQDVNSGTKGIPTGCADTANDRHVYYTYGFAIPAGATVNGIEMRLDAKADATTNNPFICVQLTWNGGTSWTALKNTPALTTTTTTYTLGSASDTWGRTWTASTDFTDSNFRVRIVDVGDKNRDFFLDYQAVRVTYTP